MAETKTRTILGQPMILGDEMVQEQILLITEPNGTVEQSENLIVLKSNIWDDLMDPSGLIKQAPKSPSYWYWNIEMTNTETGLTQKVQVAAPKPAPELFDFDFEEDPADSEWTKYWKAKMKEVNDNPLNSTNGLQHKEIYFPGTSYISSEGKVVDIPETKVVRGGLGDLGNLLDAIW